VVPIRVIPLMAQVYTDESVGWRRFAILSDVRVLHVEASVATPARLGS